MTYRLDPARKAAQRWHNLLNNGQRFAAVDARGNVIATGTTESAHQIKIARGVNPRLTLVRIADLI